MQWNTSFSWRSPSYCPGFGSRCARVGGFCIMNISDFYRFHCLFRCIFATGVSWVIKTQVVLSHMNNSVEMLPVLSPGEIHVEGDGGPIPTQFSVWLIQFRRLSSFFCWITIVFPEFVAWFTSAFKMVGLDLIFATRAVLACSLSGPESSLNLDLLCNFELPDLTYRLKPCSPWPWTMGPQLAKSGLAETAPALSSSEWHSHLPATRSQASSGSDGYNQLNLDTTPAPRR